MRPYMNDKPSGFRLSPGMGWMVGGTSEIGYDRFMAWSERIGIMSNPGWRVAYPNRFQATRLGTSIYPVHGLSVTRFTPPPLSPHPQRPARFTYACTASPSPIAVQCSSVPVARLPRTVYTESSPGDFEDFRDLFRSPEKKFSRQRTLPDTPIRGGYPLGAASGSCTSLVGDQVKKGSLDMAHSAPGKHYRNGSHPESQSG